MPTRQTPKPPKSRPTRRKPRTKRQSPPAATRSPPAATAPADPAAAADFEKAFTEFKTLLARIRSLQSKFQVSDPTAQPKVLEEFNGYVARCAALVPQLQFSAVRAYEADPSNRTAADFLMVNLVDAVEQDRHWDGAWLAKILAAGGYHEKGFHNYAGIAEFGNQDFAASVKDLSKALDEDVINKVGKEKCVPFAEDCVPLWEAEQAIRAAEAEADDLPRVKLTTTKGDIVLELFENEAPNSVANFINLVEKHFYDGLKFHRVLANFVAQGGDPKGDGTGGPGYTIECECFRPDARKHFAGSLSMAHAGRNTGGSQFFLTLMPTPGLNGKHTVFGRVIQGMDVLAGLQRIDPEKPDPYVQPDAIVKATVVRKRDHAYEPQTTPRPGAE